MRGDETPNSFRRGDEAEKPDALGSGLFERVNRRDRASAGGEHRVENEEIPFGGVPGDPEIVVDGLESPVIAVEPDVPDARGRHKPKDSFNHSEPGPEDRNQGELFASDMPPRRSFERGIDVTALYRQLAGRLIRHQHRDFIDQLLEMLRLRALVAQNGQLVLNKWMPDNNEGRKLADALDHFGRSIPRVGRKLGAIIFNV